MRLVLLPGLGADARLHHHLARLIPEAVCLDWLDHDQGTLGDLAQRYIADGWIRPGDCVGGSSLGGMVAIEIARRHPVPQVILIGSAHHPRFIQPWLRRLAPLGSRLPDAILARPALAGPVVEQLFGLHRQAPYRLAMSMLATTTPAFFRWACRAATRWCGTERTELPLRAIHGTADPIITHRRQGCERLVPGAGHLLAMTHAPQVAAFVRACLRMPA